MTLDATMKAALQSDVIGLFVAVEIVHPAGTIHLLDGAGFMVFGGKTFYGHVNGVGSLGTIDVSEDSTGGDDAPTLTIAILPSDATVAGLYAIPSAQGAAVSLWIGCFNPATGLVVGTPDLRFSGEVDTVQWVQADSEGSATALTFEIVSAFERFFEVDDGARLGDSFHQSVWPGELGFQYYSDILDTIPWGTAGTRPALTTSSS
ncbi:MAG: hypothetical protein QM647_15055 [Asticcacaulis sp.]|uniref:hypothetical protein n=1 Tax=Asticcacaulis sp. TaxID=1872648 RepID=UPI0039E4901B